jgi:hypothetical protein
MATPPLRAIPLPEDAMMKNSEVLADLLAVLEEADSEYCLIGGLVAGYHGRLRATVDVDMLVPKNRIKRIAAGMKARGYIVREEADMIRIYRGDGKSREEEGSPHDSVADLVVRESNPTLRAASQACQTATVLGHEVTIVQRGAFVAMKFHAAVSPTRKLGDRYQDIVDIERVISRTFDAKDRALAMQIADTMYPGARDDLGRALDDLAAGRPVKL